MTADDARDEFRQRSDDFWRNLVYRPDGTLDEESVLNELSDFYFVIHQVPSVYSDITGGRLSKANYYASSVLQAHEEHMGEILADARHEAVRDALDMAEAGHSRDEIYEQVAPDPMPNRWRPENDR